MCVCVTAPQAERAGSCHRKGGSHGRSPSFLLASFLSQKNPQESRDGEACGACPRDFCHLIHSFSIRVIYTAWGFEDQGTAGFKRRHYNVLTDFPTLLSRPSLPSPTTGPAKCRRKLFLMFTILQLILALFLFYYLVS